MRSSKLRVTSWGIGSALAVSLLLAATAASQTTTGSYTGDGVAGRTINIGFRPDIVIIKVDYEDLADNKNSSGVIRTSTMTGDNAKPFNGTQPLAPNLIQSLDATGFTVGNDVMVNGALAACGGANCSYYWVAFRADANTAVGGYTGNGATQSLTGFGFSPEYVMVLPAGSIRARHRTTAGTTHSRRFTPNGSVILDAITSLDADGFTINNSADSQDDPNTSGQTYYFVAWNAAPGRMAIGDYQGDDADNRQITTVGFSPLYVIVTSWDNGRDALQRTADMTGDASVSFRKAITTNRIQSFLPTGFEIGSSTSVNSNPDNYFYVAFGSDPTFVPLTAAKGGGGSTITVTAPGSFEMQFNTVTGGAIDQFFDLVEDPSRSNDMAGGIANTEAFPNAVLRSGGVWHGTTQNELGAELDLLEMTPTRVRVRQEAFYEEEEGSAILAGAKGYGEYSIYPSGRMAFHWTQEATSSIAYTEADFNLAVFNDSVAPFNGWTPFSETDGTFSNPGTDDFTLLKSDTAGVRTDFLNIMYRDWTAANGHLESADAVYHLSNTTTQKRRHLEWREQTGTTIPADSKEEWDFLVYFKPTDLGSTASPWLDPAVTTRRDDFRSPDSLSFTLGSGWNENTADADFFNESEAAYTMDFVPGTGLTLDMDGSSITRRSPVMKIRQWRSLADPVVTLEGVPLVNDVDYMADVKPVSRSHFSQDTIWYSSLQNAASVTSPPVGTGVSVSGADFPAARYGNGARFDLDGEFLSILPAGNFNPAEGTIEFWYRPSYDYGGDFGDTTDDFGLFGYWLDAGNYFVAHHEPFQGGSGNTDGLLFRISSGGSIFRANVGTGPSYPQYWRANEWVHLRFVWKADAASPRIEIYINGVLASQPQSGLYSVPVPVDAVFYIGEREWGNSLTNNAEGVIDEFRIYDRADTPTSLANGGLTGDAGEYLADRGNNFPMSFALLDGNNRGEYVCFGSDAKFRGLNVALATAGVGAVDLQWSYWNGAGAANLELVPGFTDETASFTVPDGTIYWTADPPGWQPYSMFGGPDLYHVCAYLAAGTYTTTPVEAIIKTDILLFQYGGDITAAAQTFDFAVPIPTAVELTAFDATAGDGEVLLEWETASELSNLGFHLYRASSPDGPFEAVTRTPIPGLGSSPAGAKYSYRDSGLANGVTYFYVLEDIETTGSTERHGPVTVTPVAGAAALSERASGPTTRITYGSPSDNGLVVRKTRSGLVLELSTAGFYAIPEDDGTVRIEVPDFISVDGVALPARRQWVDAVAGRQVNVVSVRALDIERVSLRPSGDGAVELVATKSGVVRTRRAARRARRRWERDTNAWARIVSVGFQGELKKALTEMSPLRWDPATGELALAKRLVVRLSLRKREPAAKATRARRRDGVVARLVTTERGLHGVRFEDIFPGRRRGTRARSLRLSRRGEDVAYHLEPRADRFGPGATLYFVGEGAEANPESKTAVYELELGEPGATMVTEEATPSGTPVTFYRHRETREENRYYQAALLDAPDLWLWDLLMAPETKSYDFTVSRLAPVPESARLRVWLQGTSDLAATDDHHVRVAVNGVELAEARWDGKTPRLIEVELAPGVLHEGVNQLALTSPGDTAAAYSMVMLDRFEVTYPRMVEGSLEGRFTESGAVDVNGVDASAYVLDVTESSPRWLGASVTRFQAEAGRSYLVTSVVERPAIRRARALRWRRRGRRADYIVIGPKAFVDTARPLLAHRRRQGLQAIGVSIEDIYDEFGFGETDPEAIRSFLRYAYDEWRRRPRYVLLLGDATYDPKDYLGTGVRNEVPPRIIRTRYLWTASDPSYGAIHGEDSLPDIAIGRLPASSVDEVRVMVSKILAYENGSTDLTGKIVLVTDNPDDAGNFDANAAALVNGVLSGRDTKTLSLSRIGAPSMRSEILRGFDEGASVMSYIGHGGIHLWAQENIFNISDVASLAPQERQPFFIAMNCLNGYFHFPFFDSLSEELLKAEGRGAIATFSSSGLSLDEHAHRFHEVLLDELLNGGHARLGDAVQKAQERYADTGAPTELLSIYHLFGDPGLVLR